MTFKSMGLGKGFESGMHNIDESLNINSFKKVTQDYSKNVKFTKALASSSTID